jgi:hypothetical protein
VSPPARHSDSSRRRHGVPPAYGSLLRRVRQTGRARFARALLLDPSPSSQSPPSGCLAPSSPAPGPRADRKSACRRLCIRTPSTNSAAPPGPSGSTSKAPLTGDHRSPGGHKDSARRFGRTSKCALRHGLRDLIPRPVLNALLHSACLLPKQERKRECLVRTRPRAERSFVPGTRTR